MNSEHLQEALSVLSRALPQIGFDPNQPIAFTKAIVQHLQAQKQQHESDLQVMNERMTESIDRMLWRITELRNELRALQSERRGTAQPEAAAELPEPQPILAKLPEPYPSKGETCSVCNWTNTSLFNLGEPDVPRWVCVGCCKRMFDRQPILADDGRSLVEVAKQARLRALARNGPGAKCEEAAAQAVAYVVLAQAIRRMEAVPVEELSRIWRSESSTYHQDLHAVRARLIAAARGEEGQQPDSTDWKARAEKAEDELAALKSSRVGILRPLSEAGPVPGWCVRVFGNLKPDVRWTLAILADEHDTHFADIRLPKEEPA